MSRGELLSRERMRARESERERTMELESQFGSQFPVYSEAVVVKLTAIPLRLSVFQFSCLFFFFPIMLRYGNHVFMILFTVVKPIFKFIVIILFYLK